MNRAAGLQPAAVEDEFLNFETQRKKRPERLGQQPGAGGGQTFFEAGESDVRDETAT